MGEYRMPSLGAAMKDGRVVEWYVEPGDTVHRGDVVGVVDTSKGAIEMEIWDDGVVEEIVVSPGEKVPVGEILFRFAAPGGGEEVGEREEREEGAREEPAPEQRGAPPAPGAPGEREAPEEAGVERVPGRGVRASPAARKRAREGGIDLSAVSGSGPDGAVVLADVEEAEQAPQGAEPGPPPAEMSEEEAGRLPQGEVHATPLARKAAELHRVDLSRVSGTGPGGLVTRHDVEAVAEAPEAADRLASMRDAIARAMARSKREIPHYYLGTTVSVHRAVEWLGNENRDRPPERRLLRVALFLKAAALAAREFRDLNGHFVEGDFRPSEAVHPGLAISLRGGGLVAPAVRNADHRSPEELTAAVRDLVQRARQGRLRSSEVTDATLTVSSLGDRGVETVYGVIYPPQVALVGVGRTVERPWAVDGALDVRPVVQITLSGDHRVSDGHVGSLFLERMGELLQRPEEL
ncbi:MAG: 2-oxo acid dehydrogenase subunit E2 [Gemmatimonadetes bacterium]|nr:2-oxo acid dehydrogenase subunit E2 [Gemmatimonadota bacterium]NIR81255.1 2-oxo acid dehydrogenase subunit E2 [Gemmatimonadota bacterium]NIT90098.1 2-oxo acid dehydrogenase subunit E2 [Gemmatimonadota bacterium]NIU33917.1 2-oxo acid dehydrogenase subunit E2 [Gemmatimonadota bacterium]NIU38096.1 2-oxo acid dehydrogenase subunit E2 [Gemmatimonadota bacterium]